MTAPATFRTPSTATAPAASVIAPAVIVTDAAWIVTAPEADTLTAAPAEKLMAAPAEIETAPPTDKARGTAYRLAPSTLSQLLIIESFSEVRFPEKGMLGQHALFDPAVLKAPEPAPSTFKSDVYTLKIKRCDQITTVKYPLCPINTVGWKGTLTVWQLNVKDIRPISRDRYHLPASAHSTLIADNFVICSFLPRPLENGDPAAMKVPFYHSNIDFDEVLFYHKGQFFSRGGITPGMMTFHPQGIHHGPQKEAISRTQGVKETNEVAIMIDTKRPLFPTLASEKIELPDYWKSWQNPDVAKTK